MTIRSIAGVQLATDTACLALFTQDALSQLQEAAAQDPEGKEAFPRLLAFLLQMGMQGVMLIGMKHTMLEAAGLGELKAAVPKATLEEAGGIKNRLLALASEEARQAYKLTDEQLAGIIDHARSLGISEPDIEALLMVSIRKPKVGAGTLKEVATSLARKAQNNEIVFKQGWDFWKAYREAQKRMLKGGALDPAEYLDEAYMKQHLAKFEGEASFLIPGDSYENYIRNAQGLIGTPDGQYLLTKPKMDEVIQSSNGDISQIEQKLGIPKGLWQDRMGLFRVDVQRPQDFQLRFPNGGESASNEFWHPGGYTSGGGQEAIISQFPKTSFVPDQKIIE
jgi:hypothetical protein